jgi:hypothetical protein
MLRRHFVTSSLSALALAVSALLSSASAVAQPAVAEPAVAQPAARATDSTVNQKWTSEYGYSILLPATARYNKIGSLFNKEGKTEKVNFILPGGAGSVTVTFFTEPRMVPKDFKTIDSLHFYQYDSTGRNGIIHRRIYVMRENAVHMDVLLTEKGETMYGALLPAIFDSFVPPPGTTFALESWRYGRDPREFESGRYGAGSGPGHDGR